MHRRQCPIPVGPAELTNPMSPDWIPGFRRRYRAINDELKKQLLQKTEKSLDI